MSEKLFTVREVSAELGIPEKDVIDAAQNGILPGFKIGGEFLRFRPEDVLKSAAAVRSHLGIYEEKTSPLERIHNFFYYNDFYIISFGLIAVLVVAIIFF